MARLEDLEFRITASTAELRSQLNEGARAIDRFARDAETGFFRLDTRFASLTRTLRTTLGLFGVGFGATMFARWTSDAVEAGNKAGDAAKAIREVKDAWNELGAAIGNSDTYQRITRGLGIMINAGREAVLPTDLEQAQADIKRLKGQITPRGSSRDKAEAERQSRLRAELQDAYARLGRARIEESRRKSVDALGVSVDAKKVGSFEEMAGILQMPAFDRGPQPEEIGVSANRLPAGFQFPLPEGWQSMAKVADDFERSRDAAERLNKEMEESSKRSKAFADNFASAFESRGIEALLDGDISSAVRGLAKDFLELTLRLAVLRPIAESLSGAFAGSGIGKIFGFAAGGRPPLGTASIVGENGPELFVPDVPGRILSNAQSRAALAGGGDTFAPTIYVQAGLPPQWEAQLAGAGEMMANAWYEAAMRRQRGQR